MARNDPSLVLGMARKAFAQPNPKRKILPGDLPLRIEIQDLMADLGKRGVNVSSLTSGQWIDLLIEAGMDPDEALAQAENIASWGVTDEE